MNNEKWKSIFGYENEYEISDLGRVRTIERCVNRVYDGYKNKHTIKSKIRKLSKHSSGYIRVSLCKNGKVKYFYVHVLVLRAFKGIKPKGFDCDHIDRDRTNNKLSNLRYLDVKKNRGIIGNKHALKQKQNG